MGDRAPVCPHCGVRDYVSQEHEISGGVAIIAWRCKRCDLHVGKVRHEEEPPRKALPEEWR